MAFERGYHKFSKVSVLVHLLYCTKSLRRGLSRTLAIKTKYKSHYIEDFPEHLQIPLIRLHEHRQRVNRRFSH